jgi:aryl-alcohol dehydrogenase-like predicted oxidoreductase
MMRTRKIGTLDVTVVGLGCNNFGGRIDYEESAAVVHEALDAGITLFDTADIYGGTKSEEFLGRALGARRAEIVLATKFGMQVDPERKGAKPDYVHRALEDSLRRLQTDHVDLYQLHAPDPDTPIAETLGALDECVRAGKVLEIGCSNFSVDQLREAEAAVAPGAAGFVSVQNEFSMLRRKAERDVLPECERAGLAFLPYFPLASGVLTGKYRRGEPPPAGARLSGVKQDEGPLADSQLATVERLTGFAQAHGRSMVELAIAWIAAHRPVASVIAGATRPDQVRANVAGADWELDDEDLAQVDALLEAPPS